MDRARLGSPKLLEGGTDLLTGHFDGPLATCLLLEAMGLVDDPMTYGWQDASLSRHVAQEQGVVGDHHICAPGTSTRSVHHALVGEEGTACMLALGRSR